MLHTIAYFQSPCLIGSGLFWWLKGHLLNIRCVVVIMLWLISIYLSILFTVMGAFYNNIFCVLVHYVQRSKKHRWRCKAVTFWCSDELLCCHWLQALNDLLEKQSMFYSVPKLFCFFCLYRNKILLFFSFFFFFGRFWHFSLRVRNT